MNILEELFLRYPQLSVCRDAIMTAREILLECCHNGGKVLVCGNGGSAADAEHIVGELMKSFRKPRVIDKAVAAKLPSDLADSLEGAIPAVSLVSMSGFVTAFANDADWDAAFAQQVYGLGRRGDVLIALSTSGNSSNCINAALVAKAIGMKVVSFTGVAGGRLAESADAPIRVPEAETFKVQELHLPVYHALCAMVEDEVF